MSMIRVDITGNPELEIVGSEYVSIGDVRLTSDSRTRFLRVREAARGAVEVWLTDDQAAEVLEALVISGVRLTDRARAALERSDFDCDRCGKTIFHSPCGRS